MNQWSKFLVVLAGTDKLIVIKEKDKVRVLNKDTEKSIFGEE